MCVRWMRTLHTEEDAKTLCDVPEFINKVDADHYCRLKSLCDKGLAQTIA